MSAAPALWARDLGVAASHQQVEIPLAPAKVTQHDLHALACRCGSTSLDSAGTSAPTTMGPSSYFFLCADTAVNAHFWHLKHYLNDNPDCHLEIGFDEGLAHLIYAGADMLVVPSPFEPCGLSKMIALKYGTVPIVRAVGGLVDTVFDRDYSARHPHDRNGYVFHQLDNPALGSAMLRVIGLWYWYPGDFRQLMLNRMRQDHSWAWPGQHYVNIYNHIRDK